MLIIKKIWDKQRIKLLTSVRFVTMWWQSVEWSTTYTAAAMSHTCALRRKRYDTFNWRCITPVYLKTAKMISPVLTFCLSLSQYVIPWLYTIIIIQFLVWEHLHICEDAGLHNPTYVMQLKKCSGCSKHYIHVSV